MNNKVCRNLSFNTTENDLQGRFCRPRHRPRSQPDDGPVERRPRGFAFVTMSTDEEALESHERDEWSEHGRAQFDG
jgi:hypothetical protein